MMMQYPIQVNTQELDQVPLPLNEPFYYVILFEGKAEFTVNFNTYTCSGRNILFLSPYQLLTWEKVDIKSIKTIQFHGDFYCIEYHKEEVACNGVLFNNLFDTPFVGVSKELFVELSSYYDKVKGLASSVERYDMAVVRTYLQLVLALSSKQKQLTARQNQFDRGVQGDVTSFKEILEEYYTQSKTVGFYAEQYNLSVDVFSKKVKKCYGKTPSKLIQERLILEAKKQLHLTHKSIKEVASILGFEDEFYFSRYFKKEVGVSPKVFRERVGISIVAKKSME